MADRDGDDKFWAEQGAGGPPADPPGTPPSGKREEVPWCGLCDSVTRHLDLPDGRVGRCPQCWPPNAHKAHAPRPGALLRQHWRCRSCGKIIYTHERELPCDRHRVVDDWLRDYDRALTATRDPVGNPGQAPEGAAVARARLDAKLARRRIVTDLPAEAQAGEDDDPGEYPF